MEVFGIAISLSDALLLGGAVISAIYGYSRLLSRMDSTIERINSIEEQREERHKSTEHTVLEMKQAFENRIVPIEAQIRSQESSTSALNATLAGIQTQLQSVSGRLDTIITQMLEGRR